MEIKIQCLVVSFPVPCQRSWPNYWIFLFQTQDFGSLQTFISHSMQAIYVVPDLVVERRLEAMECHHEETKRCKQRFCNGLRPVRVSCVSLANAIRFFFCASRAHVHVRCLRRP